MMISADKIKQAVKEEFAYRAKQGRVNYSYEEIVEIVVEVIDEVEFERVKELKKADEAF